MTLPVLIVAYRRVGLVEPMVQALRSHPDLDITVVIDGPKDPKDRTAVLDVADGFRQGLSGVLSRVRTREVNLGVGASVPAACDEFFSGYAHGVILEDDCIPTPEFLESARFLLSRYADESDVGSISGVSLLGRDEWLHDAPIRLSQFPLIWGWATWATRWARYRQDLSGWRHSVPIRQLLRTGGPVHAVDWARLFNAVSSPTPWAWDYQWVHSHWATRSYAIHPAIDLVYNRGFGSMATNTIDPPIYEPQVPREEARISLLDDIMTMTKAPILDKRADRDLRKRIWSPPIHSRLARRLSRLTDAGRRD